MNHAQPALELKGRMASLTRLRLLSADLAAIRAQLEDLSRQMPQAVRGMPVVVESDVEADLPAVLGLLRTLGMQPLAVSGDRLAAPARELGLPVLPDESRTRSRPVTSGTATSRKPSRLVDQPVRSGQQIYAEGSDLIVLAAVSPGAELIADGCVHVYGSLRGRAIAGARGDESARIFCRKFDAELVAVSGVYAVAEQMQNVRGQSVQAYLEEGKLRFEPMK
jgi:septum site-determining protein MinC